MLILPYPCLRNWLIALVIVIAGGILPSPAHASCTSPNGIAGEIIYNDGRFKGCRDTGWVFLDEEGRGGGSIKLSQYSWSAPETGDSTTITLQVDGTWIISSTIPSWLTVNPDRGSGNSSITLTATSNNTANPRSALLSFVSDDGVVFLSILQEVAPIDFTISPAVSGKTKWRLSTDGPLNLGTHGQWTITPSKNVTVNTKMWGAGGASGFKYDGTSSPLTETNGMGPGGGGGYSTGIITLEAGKNYIIQVGQGGSRRNSADLQGATFKAGGVASNVGGSQGGGYSGIFENNVAQSRAIIIAGGGGSGGDTSYASFCPAAGGGLSGRSTVNCLTNTYDVQGGRGGTQSSGGAGSVYHNAGIGLALTGGMSGNSGYSNVRHLGGGGGGYFGGGGGNVGGGGGGSGFVASTVINGSTIAGNHNTPGNNSDSDRGGAGQGATTPAKASDGRIILIGM